MHSSGAVQVACVNLLRQNIWSHDCHRVSMWAYTGGKMIDRSPKDELGPAC